VCRFSKSAHTKIKNCLNGKIRQFFSKKQANLTSLYTACPGLEYLINSPIFTGTKKARTKGPGFSVEFADQSTPGRRSKRTQKIKNNFCGQPFLFQAY